MNNKYIGIIDSGFGGISVLKNIIKLMPNEKYIFLADSKNAPYGTRSKDEILSLSTDAINRLNSYGLKSLVIACNTISVNCEKELKKIFKDLHFEITTPSISPIFKVSKIEIKADWSYNEEGEIVVDKDSHVVKKNVLILCTTATSKSDCIKEILENYKTYFNIYVEPADKIVQFVENMDFNSDDLNQYIKDILSKYNKLKFIVLACTHFPFVSNIIEKNNKFATIIDCGEETATNTYNYLLSKKLINNEGFELNIIDTKGDENRHETFSKLLNISLNKINFIS